MARTVGETVGLENAAEKSACMSALPRQSVPAIDISFMLYSTFLSAGAKGVACNLCDNSLIHACSTGIAAAQFK